MITLESNEFETLVETSAKLRGAGKFDEASNLIINNLSNMNADCLTVAYREIFLSYREAGNIPEAKKYALLLSELEPGLPSIQAFL